MNSGTGVFSKPGAIAFVAGLLVLAGLWVPRIGTEHQDIASAPHVHRTTNSGSHHSMSPRLYGSKSHRSPEEAVAEKISQFARNRLGIVKAMAERANVAVHPEIEDFFRAAEAGDFAVAKEIYERLLKLRDSELEEAEALRKVWAPLQEALGVLEVAAEWPAQALLDYGQAILSSLQPGTIYLGGTDAGRFIPTLLNETSGSERHVLLTQNAFADGTYAEYVRFLYGEEIKVFSQDNSTAAFQEYLTDAQKRLQHDNAFPDEAKQVRPGEDIRVTNNRVQVSGQVAVMSINERLLESLMKQNPDATFAMEESFPFKSLYHQAIPLGPILQLNPGEPGAKFTQENAMAAVRYWESMAGPVMAQSSQHSPERTAYAKMAATHAALLATRNFSAEAEQAYRVALQLAPSSPEAVYRFADFLANAGRADEARALLNRGGIQGP